MYVRLLVLLAVSATGCAADDPLDSTDSAIAAETEDDAPPSVNAENGEQVDPAAPLATAAFAPVHMRKALTNTCLVARSGPGERPVTQTGCANFSDQGWQIENGFRADIVVYRIRNVDRNQCMVARGSGESPVVTTTCDPRPLDQVFPDQLWLQQFDDSFGGGFRYSNFNSGNCLVGRSSPQAVQSICGNFSDQIWQLF